MADSDRRKRTKDDRLMVRLGRGLLGEDILTSLPDRMGLWEAGAEKFCSELDTWVRNSIPWTKR